MMNLNHLYYFYVLAENKSVTRAAEALGICQPSLSQQLRIFEKEVGEELFYRNGRSMELSARGRSLFEKSRELFEIADSISVDLSQKPIDRTVELKIGVSEEIERPFMAEVVGRLLRRRRLKQIKFDIISRGHDQIVRDLQHDRIDMIFTNSPVQNFKAALEFDFPVYLVTSKKQAEIKHLNELNVSAMIKILNEGLVAPTKGLALRNEIEQFLDNLSLSPSIVFESNILACTLRAIREGVGFGFAPLPYIQSDLRSGSVSILGPARGYWQHRIYLYASPRMEGDLAKNIGQVIQEYIS